MKKLFLVFPTLTMVMVLTAGLTGCGASKSEVELAKADKISQVKDSALAQYQQFVQTSSGAMAQSYYDKAVVILRGGGLDTDALQINVRWVNSHIRQLYLQNAAEDYAKLQKTHGNILQAKQLRTSYTTCMERANANISPAMEKQLSLNVSRNEVEEGHAGQRAHGVNPNPPAKKLVSKKAAPRKGK